MKKESRSLWSCYFSISLLKSVRNQFEWLGSTMIRTRQQIFIMVTGSYIFFCYINLPDTVDTVDSISWFSDLIVSFLCLFFSLFMRPNTTSHNLPSCHQVINLKIYVRCLNNTLLYPSKSLQCTSNVPRWTALFDGSKATPIRSVIINRCILKVSRVMCKNVN